MNQQLRSPYLVVVPPQDQRALADMKLLGEPTALVEFTDRRVHVVQAELQKVLTLYSVRQQPFCWSWSMQRDLGFQAGESLLSATVKLFQHAVSSTKEQDLTDCALWLLAVYRTYEHCLRPDIFHYFVVQLIEAFPFSDTDDKPGKSRKAILLEHCKYLVYCAPFQFLFFDYLGDYEQRAIKIKEAIEVNERMTAAVSLLQRINEEVVKRGFRQDNSDAESDSNSVCSTVAKLRRLQ